MWSFCGAERPPAQAAPATPAPAPGSTSAKRSINCPSPAQSMRLQARIHAVSTVWEHDQEQPQPLLSRTMSICQGATISWCGM